MYAIAFNHLECDADLIVSVSDLCFNDLKYNNLFTLYRYIILKMCTVQVSINISIT